ALALVPNGTNTLLGALQSAGSVGLDGLGFCALLALRLRAPSFSLPRLPPQPGVRGSSRRCLPFRTSRGHRAARDAHLPGCHAPLHTRLRSVWPQYSTSAELHQQRSVTATASCASLRQQRDRGSTQRQRPGAAATCA